MRYLSLSIVIFLVISAVSCRFSNKTAAKGSVFHPAYIPGPNAFVFRTRFDCSHLVPVTLNDSGTRILNYPAPSDVLAVGVENKVPIRLRKNYWLDNGSVGPNSAFLSISWEEFVKMKDLSHTKLWPYVKYKNPFSEMYDCGLIGDRKEMEKAINRLIKDGKLQETCKKLI
jgi:hypothetical protein